MRKPLVLFFLLVLSQSIVAQTIKHTYMIKSDSVKIANTDSAELIIENHTQAVPGFLFNTGNGRTKFLRGLQNLGNGKYLVGIDTLNVGLNPWLQNGNAFVATGFFGTLDNYPIDFYTNNIQRARLSANGNLILGSTFDYGVKMQLYARGMIFINPNLSVPQDFIKFGGSLGTSGQEALVSISNDSGTTYNPVLSSNGRNIGFGYGAPIGWGPGLDSPTVRIYANSDLAFATPVLYYGNPNGPFNASALETMVSNTNEWATGSAYPSGQNYYYFGVVLNGPNAAKRAPLYISADTLHFMTGATSDVEAAMVSEAGNLVLGSTTDNTAGKLQVNGNVTATGSLGLGTNAPTAQLHTTGTVRFAGLTQNNSLTRILVSDANGNIYYKTTGGVAVNDMPLSSLAVNGPIEAKKLTLTGAQTWPDYVFDSTYRLPSLPEIERYIDLNKHLAGIPSAAEVKAQGVDLGQTQAALLQKIEELTLYTINQDKLIKKKDQALQRQQEKTAALEARLAAIEKTLAQTK